MRPHLVGSACMRVQQALEQALSEGALQLPQELSAHASRCPRCAAEVRETELLFSRLHGAAAAIPMNRVPHVVDFVLARTAVEGEIPKQGVSESPSAHARWLLGQVAAVAAIILVTAGGLSYGVLKVNQAVSGTHPSEMLSRLASPFHELKQALFPNAR